MKVIQFSSFGPAPDVIECVDMADLPKAPGNNVTVEMLAMPINPADILTIEGEYGVKPPLPHIPGAEGVGRIVEIGEAVKNVAVGDLVMPMGRGSWRAQIQCPEAQVVVLPEDMDIEQASMIKVNPATAEIMLSLVSLEPGDWVVENAGNSAVGRFVIMLAKRKGLKVAAIVRREDAVQQLQKDGADVVLVADETTNSEDLVARFAAVAGDARAKLALDAVGGYSTNQLAACLDEGGLIANYGLLSGKPCELDAFQLVFRGITLTGFWLAEWFNSATAEEVKAVYAAIIPLVKEGAISAAIAGRYSLSDIKAAVAHAKQPARPGKILLAPDNTKN